MEARLRRKVEYEDGARQISDGQADRKVRWIHVLGIELSMAGESHYETKLEFLR